jgi:hypothetical protein
MSRGTDHPYLWSLPLLRGGRSSWSGKHQRLEFLAGPACDTAEWPRSRENCRGATCEICA